MSEYLAMLRRFDRNVRLYLLAGGLLGLTTTGGIIGLLMNLYVLRLGFDIPFVGVLNFSGAILFALFSFPAGALGRRWGPRRPMVLGLLFIVIGNAVIPTAELIPESWRGEYMVLTRIPRALGFALFHVNAMPFLMAATGSAERTHVFSVQAAFWSLTGFCGSLVGGFLPGIFADLMGDSTNNPEPYRYALIVGTILLLPAVLIMRRTRDVEIVKSVGPTDDAGERPTRLVVVMAIAAFLLLSGVTGVQLFFTVYLDDGLGVDTALIGFILAASQLLAGLAALATPLIAARWGHANTIIWGSVGTILGTLPFMIFSDWKAAGLGFITISSLGTIRYAAMSVYQQEMVRARWRSLMSGAASTAGGLSFSMVPLVEGFLITALGYDSLFLMSTALTSVGVLTFWLYFRTHPVANIDSVKD